MVPSAPIKPTHEEIVAHYEKLQVYGARDITHELGPRSAFRQLLEESGNPHKWRSFR
jgi:hypothetical protein